MRHPNPFGIVNLRGHLRLPGQRLWFQLHRFDGRPRRRLLCLHGAGVDGQRTFGGMLPYLQAWNEILVPDLRGAGKSSDPEGHESPFSMDEVVADLESLLGHFCWGSYDLAGYSFGGLAAMLLHRSRPANASFLLEPALLHRRTAAASLALREELWRVACLIRKDVRLGVQSFIDTLLPRRNPALDALIHRRLGARPLGLANALEAAWLAGRQLDRDALIAAQGRVLHIVGGHSHHETAELCADLAERLPDWHGWVVPGADHGLPFQRPRELAQGMSEFALSASAQVVSSSSSS